MPVRIERIEAYGWPNCYRITNGEAELVITGDVGPRVLRYAFCSGSNVFAEFADQLGKSGEDTWIPRGGSRIWIAPEHRIRTYCADNHPVEILLADGAITAIQPVEPGTGLIKAITVKLAPGGTQVEVIHRITNSLSEAQTLAPWVVTMMAPGGMGITGFPPRGTHPEALLPTNPLTMWAFTNLADPRWRFTRKYILLRQEPGNAGPQKLGHFNADTWGAYLLHSTLFLKRYEADPSKTYTDFGASFEIFTNAGVLELETLGPLETLAPGASLTHTEHWSLHRDVQIPEWTDAAIDRAVLPLLG